MISFPEDLRRTMEAQPMPMTGRSMQDIVRRVSAATGVPVSDITGRGRPVPVAIARQISYWLARKRLSRPHGGPMTFEAIGRFFKRHHKAVMHGVHAVEDQRSVDPRFRALTEKLLLTNDYVQESN